MYWNDELYAKFHGIPSATYKINKSLPIEKKLKLPVREAICSLYLTRTKYEHKKRVGKRNNKSK